MPSEVMNVKDDEFLIAYKGDSSWWKWFCTRKNNVEGLTDAIKAMKHYSSARDNYALYDKSSGRLEFFTRNLNLIEFLELSKKALEKYENNIEYRGTDFTLEMLKKMQSLGLDEKTKIEMLKWFLEALTKYSTKLGIK